MKYVILIIFNYIIMMEFINNTIEFLSDFSEFIIEYLYESDFFLLLDTN